MKVYSPIDLSEVGEVAVTRPEDVDEAIQRCREAQAIWADTPLKQRAAYLDCLTLQLARRSEEIARTVHLETGKPRLEGLNTEAMAAAASCQHASRWLRSFRWRQGVQQGSMQTMLRYLGRRSEINYRPLGVIGIISPFNFPFVIPFTQTVSAVAAGNGVILKPSSHTPMSGELVAELFADAGFPEDLVVCINGPGVGSALAKSPVDKIVFTGSGEVGRKVIQSASQRLTPCVMELGGKDAMIVMADADLDRAATAATWGAFVNCGQVCVAVKRLYVQEEVMEEFSELLVKKAKALRQGDGWNDPEVSVGPLIDGDAVLDMERQVARALEQGGRILLGGERDPSLAGHFFPPTIISGLSHDADLLREETFGPVLALVPFRDEEEALNLANDSPFALSGSVWTGDLRRGERMASSLRSGTILINNLVYSYGLPATPWGGRGESGFGRTHGEWGFLEMMEPHHVHIDSGRFPRDFWWFPYSQEKVDAQSFFTRFSFQGQRRGVIGGLMRMRKLLKSRD